MSGGQCANFGVASSRGACDAKVFYSMDFQGAVDHRHGVLAHLGGAGLVPVGHDGIADEALEFGTVEIARHDFVLGEGTKRC
jgi:hypothetical protein